MIEVLVTMVIIAFGLLGLAGLQSKMQVAEVESYQRAQALVLLNDIASRISTNRNASVNNAYVTASAIGPSTNCGGTFTTNAMANADLREWCNALKGAGEVKGGENRGAVVAGRGCVESLGNREYMVTIAWQGLVPVSAPPESVACGKDQYDASGTKCEGDKCRRFVTTIVRLAPLG